LTGISIAERVTTTETYITAPRPRGTFVSRTNLLTRLLILVAVATLPAVLVMAYMQHNLRDEGRERIAAEAMRQAELLNADLTSIVEGARQLSLAISHFTSVANGDQACRADLERLRVDLASYSMIAVLGADGQTICTTETAPPRLRQRRRGRPCPRHPRPRPLRRRHLHARHRQPRAHPAALPALHHGLRPPGRRRPRPQHRLARQPCRRTANVPPESTIGIADRNGTTVARYPDHDKFVGKLFPPGVRPFMTASQRGTGVVMGYDGKERLIGFVPPTEGPVGMFVSIGIFSRHAHRA
jgi:hypothetical protein